MSALTMTKRGPRKLRRSALEAFAGCPENFMHHYVLGLEDTSDPALRGTAYHDAKCRYVARLVEKGLKADHEEAMTALDQTLAAETVPLRIVRDVEEVFGRMAANWELDVNAFYLSEDTQDDGLFEWTPDAVYARDHELEIEDDKTYWTVMTPEQVATNFQARFYTWRAMLRWPNFPSYKFSFYFPRFNYKVSHTWTREEMDVVERDVRIIVEQIKAARKSKSYPATPGTQCAVCSYQCSIADQPAFLPVRVASREEFTQVAAQYLVAERDQKARQRVLKAFVEEQGPSTINGVEFKIGVKLSRRFPVEDVLRVLYDEGMLTLAEAGADVDSGKMSFVLDAPFSVSASNLSAYLKTKKRQAVGEKLVEVAEESPRAVFEHTKAEPELAETESDTAA